MPLGAVVEAPAGLEGWGWIGGGVLRRAGVRFLFAVEGSQLNDLQVVPALVICRRYE